MSVPFDQIKPVPTAKEQQARRVAAEGRKARLQRDTEIRRRRVLDAAWTLVSEAGLDAVNMRDLGAKAGYSAGALYSYFPSRGHLLEAMRQQVLEEVAAQQTRARKQGLKQGAQSATPSDTAVPRNAYELALLSWWHNLCLDPNRIALLLHPARSAISRPSGAEVAQPDLIDELMGATRVGLACMGEDGNALDGESPALAAVHRAVLCLAVGLLASNASALGSAPGRLGLTEQLLSAVRTLRVGMLGHRKDAGDGPDGSQADLFGQR